jgi:hypothetical protein
LWISFFLLTPFLRGQTGKGSRDKPREMAEDTVPGAFKYIKEKEERV